MKVRARKKKLALLLKKRIIEKLKSQTKIPLLMRLKRKAMMKSQGQLTATKIRLKSLRVTKKKLKLKTRPNLCLTAPSIYT